MNKKLWIEYAELFDSWRVIPRVFFASYFIYSIYITQVLVNWYVSLPSAERSLEASGFAAGVFTAVIGFLKAIFTTYSANGRDWNALPTSSSTTATIVTKETTK